MSQLEERLNALASRKDLQEVGVVRPYPAEWDLVPYTKYAINKYGQFYLYKLRLWIHGVIRQGNNTNKETLIYIPHIQYHHHLSSYNLSYPQGNRTRVCLE